MRSVLYYETRINTLKHRNKDNQNVIRKLERQLRAARKREAAQSYIPE